MMSAVLRFDRWSLVLSLFAVVLLFMPRPVHAQRALKSLFETLTKKSARVADDIPWKATDELYEGLGRSRAVREAAESSLSKSAKHAARSDDLLAFLRSSAPDLDPALMRRIDQLDDASRETALMLARGGEHVRATIPDLAERSRFLREGGPETVTAVGSLGPDTARAAMRLDAALQAGRIAVPRGGRAVTLADFGRVMCQGGRASWSFWQRYVQPHWKVWLASGALAAYLANPQAFQDAAGQLTEAGLKRLTELAGSTAAAAICGIGEGTGNAIEDVSTAVRETYLLPQRGRFALIGTIVFLGALSLLFRRIRQAVLRPFRWLHKGPNAAPSQTNTSTRNTAKPG